MNRDLALAVEIEPGGTEPRLLEFYDRLRERIHGTLTRRRLSGRVADTLLLAPDLFMLLVRLFLDPEVPRSTRALIGGAIAYYLLPVDVMPELFMGAGGFLDDVVLASGVLAHLLTGEVGARAARQWSGPEELRVTVRDVSRSAEALLGERVHGRLQRWLRQSVTRSDLGRAPGPGSTASASSDPSRGR